MRKLIGFRYRETALFSYRHSYHAGNHADVLKHVCQIVLLEKFKLKDKPFVCIDTHSGGGVYGLPKSTPEKEAEWHSGVGRLNGLKVENKASELHIYSELTARFMEDSLYPGSAKIAEILMRPQDKLHLTEWHNNEINLLKQNVSNKNVSVYHQDGFKTLQALVPPKPKRGMVLIDPPYELIDEYRQVSEQVSKALKKWQTGVFAVWYPILGERAEKKQKACDRMLKNLSSQPFKSLLNIQLIVESEKDNPGMYGSGMVIGNVPWQVDTKMKAYLQLLMPYLAQSNAAKFNLEWLIKE